MSYPSPIHLISLNISNPFYLFWLYIRTNSSRFNRMSIFAFIFFSSRESQIQHFFISHNGRPPWLQLTSGRKVRNVTVNQARRLSVDFLHKSNYFHYSLFVFSVRVSALLIVNLEESFLLIPIDIFSTVFNIIRCVKLAFAQNWWLISLQIFRARCSNLIFVAISWDSFRKFEIIHRNSIHAIICFCLSLVSLFKERTHQLYANTYFLEMHCEYLTYIFSFIDSVWR